MNPTEYLNEIFRESRNVQDAFLQEHGNVLIKAAEKIARCIKNGGKVLVFGNGGSASDSQHLAAELVGRLVNDRSPLPAIALTADTSNLTAISNDYGFEKVFSRQISALANPQDIVIAISTSGKSRNVIEAVLEAKRKGCPVICLTGGSGGDLKGISDLSLVVTQGKNSCRIQETHILAIHSMVDLMERYFLD